MIPVCEPVIGSREAEYVSECIRSGWISSAGRYLEQFEKDWAAYCGVEHGVAVSSGTAALILAVAASGLEPGDEVIIPTFTIISCALAVIYAGCTPVFVDADPETWCLDVDLVEERISPRTRAILPVHIYGHPVNMDPLREIADRHGLLVIEDAAEAHGAEYRGRRCGGLGDMSCFSFYANKIVTTGEGGMVLTNSPVFAERLRDLRNLCFGSSRRFLHTELGHNFRLTNLQAALGVAQIERVDLLVERKRQIADQYRRALAGTPGLQLPVERDWAKSVYWMYGIVLDPDLDLPAEEFAKLLRSRGVDTRPFFLPLHQQPVLRERGFCGDDALPIAERLGDYGLYLPSGLGLSESEIAQCCDAVLSELERVAS